MKVQDTFAFSNVRELSGSLTSVRMATLNLTTTITYWKPLRKSTYKWDVVMIRQLELWKKHKQYKTQHFSLSALTFNEEYINNKHWWTETDTIPMN